MSAFIYLSELDDRVQDAESITFSHTTLGAIGSDPEYPLTNLQTTDISELWRSEALGGSSPISIAYYLHVDLGTSGAQWDLVTLINHDFDEFDTLVALYSGATNVLGSMTFHGYFTWREFDMYMRLATPVTHRHLRVMFGAFGGWVASMGRLMVGLSVVSPIPPKYGWSISPNTKAIDLRSAFNVKHIDVFCQYHEFNFPFIVSANSAANSFMAFLKSLLGMKYWFFLIPDSTEYEGYVVRQMSQPRRIRGYYNEFDDVRAEEESRGVRIGS